VIDAGDGVVRRVAKAGVRLQDIGTSFITHHHDDHTAGLGPLMSAAWDQNRTQPINVYGPPGTDSLVKAAIAYFTLSSEIRIADEGRSVPIARVFFGHDVIPATDVLVAEVNSVEDRKLGMIADGRWAAMSETKRAGIMEQAARGHLSPGKTRPSEDRCPDPPHVSATPQHRKLPALGR
jgi:ribonuclease BN (tRNA processing enzyme)